MPASIIKHCGVGKEFPSKVELQAYLSGLNLITLDSVLTLKIDENFEFPFGEYDLAGADETRYVQVECNDSFLAGMRAASTFNWDATLPELTLIAGQYSTRFPSDIHFRYLNLKVLSSFPGSTINFRARRATGIHTKIQRCRITDTTNGFLRFGAADDGAGGATGHVNKALVEKCLWISESTSNRTMYLDVGTVKSISNTYVARGPALGTARVVEPSYAGSTFTDCVFIGFGPQILGPAASVTNSFSNTQPTTGVTAGITVVTAVGGLVVNEASNFIPTAPGPLIGAGSASLDFTQDIRGLNMGSDPDVGAWEQAPAAAPAELNVTSITVTGQQVVISGTTANTPTTGTASIAPTNAPYNSGEAQGPANLTFGTGTFTVTFNTVKVGPYNLTLAASNGGGPATISGLSTFAVTGASGAVTSHTLNGQVLTISGTTTGTPTSGSYIVPVAATSPGNAIQQNGALTLGTGTFSVSITLPPGKYDPTILRFTTAAGTSLPIAGTSGVEILELSGNPTTPDPAADTGVPVMQGALVSSAITSSGFTVTWQAATDNVAVAGYESSLNSGAYSTIAGGASTLSQALSGLTASTAYPYSVRAFDAAGNRSAPLSITVTTAVAPANSVPTFSGTIANISGTAGVALTTVNVSARFSDTDTLSYSVSPNGVAWPAGMGISSAGVISGTVASASTTTGLRVRATDTAGQTVDSNAFSVTIAAAAVGRTVTISLSGAASLSNLEWAWFDQIKPSLFGAPTDKGSVESTTADGVLVLNLPNSTLSAGQVGWLELTNSDGNPATAHKGFGGPVAVS